MKVKLYKKICSRAYDCAHITSITRTCTTRGDFISGVSIGYGIYNNGPYKNIWCFNMDEDTFDRKVRQVYWELNKERYYKKYRNESKRINDR